MWYSYLGGFCIRYLHHKISLFLLTLMYNPSQTETMFWSLIWNLNLPENICDFISIIMHRKLPNNCTWVTHHVLTYVSCYRWGKNNKTILHTLRICPKPCKFGIILIFHLTMLFMRMICIIWSKEMRLEIPVIIFLFVVG